MFHPDAKPVRRYSKDSGKKLDAPRTSVAGSILANITKQTPKEIRFHALQAAQNQIVVEVLSPQFDIQKTGHALSKLHELSPEHAKSALQSAKEYAADEPAKTRLAQLSQKFVELNGNKARQLIVTL